MNNFNATGYLGKNGELKMISGSTMVEFSIAVKAGYGEKEQTMWVVCSLWGKRAESIAPYLIRGQLVGVNGELSTSEWTTKEGEARTTLRVRCNDLTLLGKKDSNVQSDATDNASNNDTKDFDDDVPF